MNKRQQRENLARAKALNELHKIDSKYAMEFVDFVIDTHIKYFPPRKSETIRNLARDLLRGVHLCYGEKVPTDIFTKISIAVFYSEANELVHSSKTIDNIKELFQWLDKFLVECGSVPFQKTDFSYYEAVIANKQSKELHNLHLTQKVQERKVML